MPWSCLFALLATHIYPLTHMYAHTHTHTMHTTQLADGHHNDRFGVELLGRGRHRFLTAKDQEGRKRERQKIKSKIDNVRLVWLKGERG